MGGYNADIRIYINLFYEYILCYAGISIHGYRYISVSVDRPFISVVGRNYRASEGRPGWRLLFRRW
jgi:hypothetical protein